VHVAYKGHIIGVHRLDTVVDDKLVVESKASHDLPKGAIPQIQSYLHATIFTVGLLLHYGPSPKFFRFLSRSTGRRESFPYASE
jgi:GxxExxY protein